MSIIRNDTQVALNDLHVALKHSADHYREAGEFLQDGEVSAFCEQAAADRDQLAGLVEQVIRESGQLPSVPDQDRETGEQLLERLESLFSADETREVLQNRLDIEQQLLATLDEPEMAALDKQHAELKARCRNSVTEAIRSLKQRIG
ncbi:hypothetical protein [Microbulbifer guangxiensis]|uniref:hypothetical protein n=1 Tax=Microbulbifer guangxiensis TaxID=2904249 RepID=UPI001F2A4CC9|nr:hypothetical protein [Microbulbifer guangxiensis]